LIASDSVRSYDLDTTAGRGMA